MIVKGGAVLCGDQPSDVVFMENIVRPDTKGRHRNPRWKSMNFCHGGCIPARAEATGFVPVSRDKKNPFELYEAENAVMLARLAGPKK